MLEKAARLARECCDTTLTTFDVMKGCKWSISCTFRDCSFHSWASDGDTRWLEWEVSGMRHDVTTFPARVPICNLWISLSFTLIESFSMTAFSDYYFCSRADFQIPQPTPSMTRTPPSTPEALYLLELRSSKSFILLTVCAAIFTDSFLYGVLIPVIPFTLHDRSGIPESDVQWWTSLILAGYGLMVLIGSPISGTMQTIAQIVGCHFFSDCSR